MKYYKDNNNELYAYELNNFEQWKKKTEKSFNVKLTEVTKVKYDELLYEINNPPLTVEQRIQQIESKCNQAIEAVYPIYKQINITNLLTPYTEDDREDMKAFIDGKRAICHKAIDDGIKPEDVDFSNES